VIKVFLRIIFFSLAVVGVFVWVANSIPQVIPQRGPTAEDLAKLDQSSFARAGKGIFNKNCSQCHAVGDQAATRCPNLSQVGRMALSRARLPENRERLKNDVAYFTESLYDPKAFVVEGYPPIMPKVFKPPIDLSGLEIKAVIAYLQSLGGEVTVTARSILPTEKWEAEYAAAKSAGASIPVGDPRRGARFFYQKMRCVACHKVDGFGGILGPNLSDVGAINTREYLLESIVDPGVVLVKGYKDRMPQHFGNYMTDKELDNLVAFLQTLRGSSGETP